MKSFLLLILFLSATVFAQSSEENPDIEKFKNFVNAPASTKPSELRHLLIPQTANDILDAKFNPAKNLKLSWIKIRGDEKDGQLQSVRFFSNGEEYTMVFRNFMSSTDSYHVFNMVRKNNTYTVTTENIVSSESKISREAIESFSFIYDSHNNCATSIAFYEQRTNHYELNKALKSVAGCIWFLASKDLLTNFEEPYYLGLILSKIPESWNWELSPLRTSESALRVEK